MRSDLDEVSYWDGDLDAFGVIFASYPKKLLYLSVYGLPDGHVAYKIEIHKGSHNDTDFVSSEGGTVESSDELIELVETVFPIES